MGKEEYDDGMDIPFEDLVLALVVNLLWLTRLTVQPVTTSSCLVVKPTVTHAVTRRTTEMT